MQSAGKSVVGMRRDNNEDAIFLSHEESPVQGLYIVADGMGGCNAGEVASQLAIDAFLQSITEEAAKTTEPLDMLVGGIVAANQAVYQKSLESESFSEMGTTMVGAMVKEQRLYVAHVGDSRAYVCRDGHMKQLTIDHSYVMELVRLGNLTMEQAAVHPKRHIITRAVGIKDTVEVDTVIFELAKGDQILMCSDGLSNMLLPEEMAALLSANESPETKCGRLVDLANQKGGLDNISVILIEE